MVILTRSSLNYLGGGAASFPVVVCDFGCDVTCQACRENSPIALGSRRPLVTLIARTEARLRAGNALDRPLGTFETVVARWNLLKGGDGGGLKTRVASAIFGS